MYNSLEENNLIEVNGTNYLIFDPKQRETPVDYDKFKKLLDNIDNYKLTSFGNTTYTNLGQVIREMLKFKDKQGPQQNERFKVYENVVTTIIHKVKPKTKGQSSQNSFNPEKGNK